MKNLKGFRKAILPAIAMLIASVVSLTSVTYAWFTAGTKVSVSQIDVNVAASGGIQIAKNGTTAGAAFQWGSTATGDTLGYNATTAAPVSTDGTLTNGALTFYTCDYDDNLDKINKIATTNSGYITLTAYLLNPSSETKYINLDGTTVTSAVGNSNLATRIGVIKQGSLSSTSSITTSSAFTDESSKICRIYEPNATTHTSNAVSDYNAYKGAGKISESAGECSYMGLNKASEDGTTASKPLEYINRYTGDIYKIESGYSATERKDTPTSATENAKRYVFDKDYASSNSGETLRLYKISDDYKAIANENTAAQLKTAGTDVYVGTDTDDDSEVDTFTEVEEIDGHTFSNSNDYYQLECVDLYTKVAFDTATPSNNNMKEVTTITDLGNKVKSNCFTLAPTTVNKFTVYIWLEGQDCDCENSVGGYSFSVNLSITDCTTSATDS